MSNKLCIVVNISTQVTLCSFEFFGKFFSKVFNEVVPTNKYQCFLQKQHFLKCALLYSSRKAQIQQLKGSNTVAKRLKYGSRKA